MDESEDNMSAEDVNYQDSLLVARTKPKKRSLVERELETNLTARVTSPISNIDASSTSRYGRARRLKTDSEFVTDSDKVVPKTIKSPNFEKTPVKTQSPVYKMHASNSPIKPDSQKCTPKKRISLESNLDNQIENIYHENISLSRFGSDEKKSLSPGTKTPKVYVRKDLIQKRNQDEETMSLIKNMFSPVKSSQKSKSHLSNILERSSEKYSLNAGHTKSQNGYSSVVKTLDFDTKKKKENRDTKAVTSKSDLFDVEAKCEYQVGDLAWARMGTYPFWPCIVTREPLSGMFVKRKLFGRIEHDIIHVTFFGDNGRRSWIVDNLLRKFLGQLEFEATRERFTPADKKRDPRFYAAFFISEKKQHQWNISVEEAEMLLREPKRLRIDVLYDMIHNARAAKTTPKQHKSGKITRTGSDVSLSESLYDTLFSEDDGKAEDTDRSRNKSRNKSLDVSEVVTACLDNMAAKTGITKIQRQSHMDRWLQKAKSKTPEKSQAKAQVVLQKVEKGTKTTSSKKKKRSPPKPVISQKPYSFRKYANESQNVLPHNFDHDYGTNFVPQLNSTLNDLDNNGSVNDIECIKELQRGIGIISKVESLNDSINSSIKKNAPKIDDCSQDKIVEENDTAHNKNTSSTILSENIETDKGNIIYDIEIEVDALSVQDEDQSKNYESMLSAEEKLTDGLLDQTLSGNIENQGTVESSNENGDIGEIKIIEKIVNQCTKDVNQSKLDNIQESNINNEPYIKPDIGKSMTNVNDNTEIPTDEDMEVNEVSLNEEKDTTQVKTIDNIREVKQPKLVDQQEQHNEAHSKTDIDTDNTKDNVKENTKISIEKDIELDVISLNNENGITEVELGDNTEMSIDMEPDEKVTDVDCDSIVNNINAIIEDNLQNKISIHDMPDKLDTNKVVTDADHSEPSDVCEDALENRSDGIDDIPYKLDSNKIVTYADQSQPSDVREDATGNRSDGVDMKNVQEKNLKQFFFDSVNASVSKVESETVSDTDHSESSKNYEDTKGNGSDRIENQNVQKQSYENDCSEYLSTSRSHTKTETISNDDQSELSEVYRKDRDITGNRSDVMNENVQEKSSENLMDSYSQDKCSAHHTETTFEASVPAGIKIDSNNSNDLNKKTDLELENMGTSQHVRNSRIHYVSFKESAIAEEEDLFAHLPEIEILITDTSKKNKISVDQQVNTDVKTTEGKSKCIENHLECGFSEHKLTNEVGNDKDLFQTDNLVNVISVITDQVLPNCISEKKVDKCTISVNYKSDSDPTVTNSVNKLTNEVINDKDLFKTESIANATTDQVLPNCILEKKVDKCTIADSCKSDSDPTITNITDSSILTSDSVIVNGFHTPKGLEDLEGDTSSINSEDIEPLSVTRNKMLKEKVKPKLEDPDFVAYLEMRQDDLIAEHPELNQNEIVEYLYKTWKYEENAKSDIRKNDDIQQLNLVKGLESKQESARKRSTKDKKHIMKERKKRNAVDSDFDTASIKSGDSVTSMKRWLRPKKSALYNEIFFDDSRGTTPEKIKAETDIDTVSLCSIESELSIQTPTNEIELVQGVPLSANLEISVESKTETVSIDLKNTEPSNATDAKTTKPSSKVNGFTEKNDTDKMIKVEFDPETASINSASSEVSISKRKQKSKYVDKNGPSLDDPEFVKYLELRQDTLIDENPQLTHDEIVGYLYKTWLYEESVKSDIKKTDEIEQSNLVKGLKPDQEKQRKKIKKKIKVERDLKDFVVQDDATIKEKPKRKTAQANYYNEDFSDIEDEIQMFEIMKGKSIPQVQLTKLPEPAKSVDNAVIEIADEVDEVELYFEELAKPKPNLFKGLIREKVCEICERTGNLAKCKGCNSMFHIDCIKKDAKVVETIPLPSKYKKRKKKKLDRKIKSLEDSESHSDEKSQDVSAELDVSVQPQLNAIDAENFEAQLEAKMKELLESNQAEVHYDSYSSDDGIDWSDTVAGQCEIVDIKLKRKTLNIDYSDFKCNNCVMYDVPVCFVCKLAVSKTGLDHKQRCQVAHCHKYYHVECLDHWPQTQFTSSDRDKKTNELFEHLTCPRHVCHTCVSDDPRGCKTRFSGDKLARCVRCPATYHSFTKCVPAGTKILTGSHIICPRHFDHKPGKALCHVNTGWCFICAVGGTLICCEYCPTSFHAECLNIKPPEGSYMCEDCETGRLPLYGEMVWVKLGHYRWWPGIILHPSEIPDNLLAVKHSLGEFVVRFFGQYDHYWVNRGRVFPFQEGDSGRISNQKSKIDADFTTAMEHAYRACEILKTAPPNEEESLDIASSLLPPHYVKLKVNKPCGSLCGRRVDIEESSLTQCECNPDEEDPCGPYSQCLNRMLLTECGPICRAGDRCNNRAFEKRLYPKMVPYRTPHRGWGLKTLEDIKAGQFVIEYVGELIDEEEFKRRMNRKHEIRDENFYFLTLDKERMIDAGPKGNLARFMNHSCEPNCETQKWTVLGDVRVGLFAIHDIPANSEVTFNYNLECAGIDKKRCLCGTKRCPGYIGAKPKQDESQPKKPKFAVKRTYKKRKNTEESPSTKNKPKRPVGRPAKPRELTEIEKDLLIIKNATNGLSSDSDCSRLSSVEGDKNQKALKRKRVSFSTEESVVCNGGKSSPIVKKIKLDKDKSESVM